MSAKILIVHDQPELLEKAQMSLSRKHTVTIASGIQEAITVLKELEEAQLDRVPVDLVLCSVHIEPTRSTLTVFDLLKWTRGNPQIKEVPFLLVCFEPSKVAQYLVDSIRVAGASLGASGYVVMDQFNSEKFLELVERYLPAKVQTRKEKRTDSVDEIAEFSPTEAHINRTEARKLDSEDTL